MKQLIKEGKPLYGESSMPEHIQEMSARNSRFAQLKFSKSLVQDIALEMKDIDHACFLQVLFLGSTLPITTAMVSTLPSTTIKIRYNQQ